jgi:hypothetical protein
MRPERWADAGGRSRTGNSLTCRTIIAHLAGVGERQGGA